MLCFALFTSAHAFCQAKPSSMKRTHPLYIGTSDQCSPWRRTSRLYYINHDPILENSIKYLESSDISKLEPLRINGVDITSKTGQPVRTKTVNEQNEPGIQDRRWNTQYAHLLEFKHQHGHCLVPQHYPPNPKLGLWVMAQRRYYKLNKGLTQRHKERRQLLNRAGFVFSVDRRGPRMAKLKERSKDKNIKDMDNFVGFMIDNKNELSEVEKREAWKMRFSVYQK